MAKKKSKSKEGAPEWMVTYGDMMTLLLCFFVMLAAFSELKKEEEFERVIQAFQEAFGYTGGSGKMPTDQLPEQSIIQKIEEIALHNLKYQQQSNTSDPSIYGRETTVQNIREGLKFIVGGMITFEPGSADLKPEGTAEIRKLAEVIRGKQNLLEVRGHTSAADLTAAAEYNNLWDLSYARARAVKDVLTSGGKPVRPSRIRLVGCSDNEPLLTRVLMDDPRVAVNRRVEIIVTETLVQEVAGETTDGQLTSAQP